MCLFCLVFFCLLVWFFVVVCLVFFCLFVWFFFLFGLFGLFVLFVCFLFVCLFVFFVACLCFPIFFPDIWDQTSILLTLIFCILEC